MELETTFYILGIIYMILMFVIMIGVVVAVFIIKAKIDAIHRQIEEKLSIVTNIAHVGADVVDKAKRVVGRNK